MGALLNRSASARRARALRVQGQRTRASRDIRPPPRLHYEMPQPPAPVAVTATGSLTFPNPGATSMKSGEQGTPIAGLGVAFELSWESTK